VPPGTDARMVRDATPDDIGRVVSVHIDAFNSFFLTSLGTRFLELLYRAYLAHPSGVLLVAGESDGHSSSIGGFVAGTTDPPAFYAWLRRSRGMALGVAAAPALVGRPRAVIPRLLSAMIYQGDVSPSVASSALLASLAVHPDSGGRGLGRMLVDAFVSRSRERGRDGTFLTTDAIGNDRVLDFYRRNGFQEARRFVRGGGREMVLLVRENVDRPPGADRREDVPMRRELPGP
jgi:ribosomal protein S18 acetylase RimI-like enzyme